MKKLPEVIEFLEDLQEWDDDKLSFGPRLVDLIEKDIKYLDKAIVNRILAHKLKLEGSWTNYQLADIDVIYNSDMLKFSSMLEMYGIADNVYGLTAGHVSMVLIYRFIWQDYFGGELDNMVGFHVIISGDETQDYIPLIYDKYIVLHDD